MFARLAILVAAAALALPSSATADLAGQWHLDVDSGGSTPDSSGHGLSGATTGIGLLNDGRFGNAFRFDFGSIVRVADSPLLEPQRLTVAGWVRYGGGNPIPNRYVIAKGGDAGCSNSSYALATGPLGGLVFSIRMDSSSNAFLSPAVDPQVIWDGDWHAVAGVYDGARVRLYVDGAQVGSGTPATTTIAYGRPDDSLAMGTYPQCAGSGYDFPGDLDEARVYDRALSASEMAVLQNPGATTPPVVPPPGGGGGPVGPPVRPPTARFISAKSPTIKRAVWMNGALSTAVAGKTIKSYAWDFNDDGRIDANCNGEAPAVSHPFPKAGNYDVRLTVTDSAGLTASVKQPLSVARSNVNRAGRENIFDCERPLGGNQPDRPGCVKTFAFGYIEVNGRGDAEQCFEVEGRPRERQQRAANAAQKGTLKDFIDYRAKIDGPVALNGLPIPVPKGVKSEYDSGKDTIGIGTFPILVPKPGGGTIRVADVPLEKKIVPTRTRDYPDGVFTLVSQKLEGNLKGWGGLSRGAGIEVLLLRRASIVKVSVKLPNVFTLENKKTVEGWAAVRASNADGFTFDGMKLGPLDAFLGPVIVSKLQFTYSRSADTWTGGGDIQLLPAGLTIEASPPINGFGLRRGAFDHAGFAAAFDVQPQLFPGVGLRRIGGAIGINPLRFFGQLAITAGGTITIDSTAFMAFASPEDPYDFPAEYAPPGLGFLSGRRLDSYSFALGGTASLRVPKLGELPLVDSYVFYAYPDYVEFAGKADIKPFGDKFKIKGGVDGWLDVSREQFNLEGAVEACVDISVFDQCLGVGAVVSSRGIAFCTLVPLPVTPVGPVIPVPAGVGYRWGQGFPPDIMIFSCDRGPYREAKPATAAQAGARTVTIPDGVPSASVRVTGRGGAPKVLLTGPRGERITVPQTDRATADPDVIALTIPETSTTEIFLKEPSPGRWTVTAQPGSAAIAGVASANGLAAPRVRARVTGRGHRRTLRYTAPVAAGQTITFVERGARTATVLGKTQRGRGRIRFTPADGPRGRREIAALIERGGVVTRSLTVARYSAPGPQRPGKPRRLRVTRRGTTLLIRWRPARAARAYAVSVRVRNAPALLRVTRKRIIRIRGVARRARGTVLVGGLRTGTTRTGPQARKAIPRKP